MFEIDTMHPVGMRTFTSREKAERAAEAFDVPRGRVRRVQGRADRLADVIPLNRKAK